MSGSPYLLDTNAAIAFLGGDRVVVDLVSSEPENYVALVVLAELYYGAEKSSRGEPRPGRSFW